MKKKILEEQMDNQKTANPQNMVNHEIFVWISWIRLSGELPVETIKKFWLDIPRNP